MKELLFTNKVTGDSKTLLFGDLGRYVYALTKSVDQTNDAIRWCCHHYKKGDLFDCKEFSVEITNV